MTSPLIFVAGTGTGVGKTQVTVALLQAFSRLGVAALAGKPIETGVTNSGDLSTDMAKLAAETGMGLQFCNSYALHKPASPHLAARLQGVTIDPARVVTTVRQAAARRPEAILLVEGAGGLRVPLAPGYEMIDLAAELGAQVLLVGRSGLGTLNETLLSLEALARRGLPVLGTILSQVRPDEDPELQADNLDYLSRHAPFGVLGLLPFSAPRLEEHVDVAALLRRLGQGGSVDAQTGGAGGGARGA